MRKSILLSAVLTALCLVGFMWGCESASGPSESASDGDSDGDGDGDGDGDSDGDGDGDSDVQDSDGDGLSDDLEEEIGTDPEDDDTDNDGVSDMVEWIAGTDPLDPDSNPGAEGNFYFLMPYNEDPDPTQDTLVFGTDIQKADLFFLVDTTGSMGGEISNLTSSLSGTIIPQVADIIPDVWFGVGRFDDYPVSPYGSAASGDVIFELNQRMTSDTALAQAAVSSLGTHFGSDGPEGGVPALWATALGEGLGSYLDPQTACDADEIGYPCFRDGAIPIVTLITDAPFHNGPGGSEAYSGITPDPPTYIEAVDALNYIHAKVLTIYSTDGDGDAYNDCVSISTDTGAVDLSDDPLVFSINGDGTGIGTNIVDAVHTLATDVPMDRIAAVPWDDDTDGVDAPTAFIDRIVPNTTGGVEDPESLGTFCVGGLETVDDDTDGFADAFINVLPGTAVCFDIIPKMNETVSPSTSPQVFKAFVDVVGNDVTVLDTRTVFFLVPPSGIIVE